jgi:hypothetical protein
LIPAQSDIKSWVFDALQTLGPDMEQLRQPQNKMIGIKPAAKNDAVDMVRPTGVAAE